MAATNQDGNLRGKFWCFTINNPGDYRPVFVEEMMRYMVYEQEKGAEGTLHLQGYIACKATQRMATIEALVGGHAHLERAQGSEEQNKTYCTKEPFGEDPREFGSYQPDANRKGARTDLRKCTDMINKGATIAELAVACPSDFVRYHSGLLAYRQAVMPEPEIQRPVFNLTLWGPTGVGKTHRILHAYPKTYKIEKGRDPFGGYNGQKVVLFTEFNYADWPIQTMNKCLDKWKLSLDCRYANKWAAWTLTILEGNTDPVMWYPMEPPALREAFLRRLSDPIGAILEVTCREQEIELPADPEDPEVFARTLESFKINNP
nr:MAG: replication associated protein [Arizlama virus]